MAIIPTDWLPYLTVLAVAFIVDQIRFGGKYTNSILDKATGNTYERWTLRPESRFKGRHGGSAEVVGYVNRTTAQGYERPTLRLAFITDSQERLMADADDLDIPPQALKRWYVDSFDIGLRSDKLKQLQEEVDQLKFRLGTANAKANLAFTNSVDFTSKLTASMGEWKKNIGTTTMIATKSASGGYNITQPGEEGGGTSE